MAQLPRRIKELSPDRRQLLHRLLADSQGAPPVGTARGGATVTPSSLEPLNSHKAECRRFYDEISHRLDESGVGPFSLFLNLGYVAGDTPSESNISLPEHVLNKSSIALVLEVIGSCDLHGCRVLDVGCGRGGTVSVMKQYFTPKHVCGVDLAPAAIQFCRSTNYHPNVLFEVGDAEKLPFPDNSFEIVTNIESSSTYPDIRAFYGGVFRVLAPGGSFLYTDAMPAEHFAAYTALLQEIGLTLQVDRDITSNVLKSCDEVAGRRLQSFDAGTSGDMADFLGAPGSQFYQEMKRGAWNYRIQRWQKPGLPAAA